MTIATPEISLVRPVTLDDAALVTDLLNACSQAALGLNTTNAEELTQEWQYPGFDLATESHLVLDVTGRAIAYGAVWNRMEPYVRIYSSFHIHPDYQQDTGLGRDLLTWIEAAARLKIDKAPVDAQISLHADALSVEPDMLAHLAAFGMDLKRHFFMMQIDMDAAPEVPSLPEGLSITTLTQHDNLPVIVRTTTASFRDHYGFVETPYEEEYEDWGKWIEALEVQGDFDASLWFMLRDDDLQDGDPQQGGNTAGVSICVPRMIEDPDMGYVEILGIRREWRRRGLALTLLLHTFAAFWQRGTKKVALHVDASSLTGATRLYEKAGMRVVRQYDSYRLILRAGVDLSTQALAD